MSPADFHAILAELTEENPLAVRAVLRILKVEFTEQVPTLAVTMEDAPRLLVNLGFVREHCHSDAQVKAVLMHEYLHVLLRHTEARVPLTPSRHLALDAIINAIIHRQLGPDYSALMSRYYARERGVRRLLRPMTEAEQKRYWSFAYKGSSALGPDWIRAWHALYRGQLVVDDIEALADTADQQQAGRNAERLLGNHDFEAEPDPPPLPQPLQDALNRSLKEMNGDGIWRSPRERGVGANPYQALFNAAADPTGAWKRQAMNVLRRHLAPDRRSGVRHPVERSFRIPVLSPGDRRAFLAAGWLPYLPEAVWNGSVNLPEGTAQVYLDVSGSMNAEMGLLIALLGRLSRCIRRPFWAFSDELAPAVIENGQLKTSTSGGTSLACVIAHLKKTRPAAAVIITDGYIERLPADTAATLAPTRVHALVSRDGNPGLLTQAGIPTTQLPRIPT